MFTIHEAATDDDWNAGCALLQRVYVDGGFTPSDRADDYAA